MVPQERIHNAQWRRLQLSQYPRDPRRGHRNSGMCEVAQAHVKTTTTTTELDSGGRCAGSAVSVAAGDPHGVSVQESGGAGSDRSAVYARNGVAPSPFGAPRRELSSAVGDKCADPVGVAHARGPGNASCFDSDADGTARLSGSSQRRSAAAGMGRLEGISQDAPSKTGCLPGFCGSDVRRDSVQDMSRSRIHSVVTPSHARARSVFDDCSPASALRPPAASGLRVSGLSSPCAGASSFPLSFAAVVARSAALPSEPAARAGVGSVEDSLQDRCPRDRSCTKGGVSRPSEDKDPDPKGTGTYLRTAGGVRGPVVGSSPERRTRTQKALGAVTPSVHLGVPKSLAFTPGRGKGLRQQLGWKKVLGNAHSGIWVLKGESRGYALPSTLDHLGVVWMEKSTYSTAWVTPTHACLCSYKYGRGAAVGPQSCSSIWNGVMGLWGTVAPL